MQHKGNRFSELESCAKILIEWTKLPRLREQLKQAGITGGLFYDAIFKYEKTTNEAQMWIVRNSFDIEV